jgi:hypothetical protein
MIWISLLSPQLASTLHPTENKMKNRQFKDYFTPAGRERKKPERECTRACRNT